jgi:hypothetical protein
MSLQQPGAPRRNGGRNGAQKVFTEALFGEICDRLATGESLRAICRDPHMPDEKAVRKWVTKEGAHLGPQYTLAREMGFDSLAEEVIEISDSPCVGPDGYVDNGAVQRARLMADSRRWFLSKVMPKKYGDKVTQELVGNADQPIVNRIELVAVDPRPALPRVRVIDNSDDEG